MNDLAKTTCYIGVALLLAAAAYLSRPSPIPTAATFDDTGEAFFPDFDNPLNATAMEVFEYDDDTGQPNAFRVEYKDNRWTIPSHHNYPADAKDRLAKTAGALAGLTKDAIVSNNPQEHADMGVVDPNETGAASKGWGTRIKLFDKSGNTIVDLIVGDDVEEHPDFKYMRVPGADRVYRVKADKLDLSTNFSDWIDTDLLELSSFDINQLTLKDYRVDLEQQRILDSGTTVVRKGDDSKWALEEITPPLKENEEVDESKIRDMTNAVADLKIVGVREKPEGLKPDLSLPDIVQAAFQQQMAARGFYVTRQGLYSNDGEVIVETNDGLVYTLRFGGAIVGTGEELTAGAADEKAAQEKDAEPKEDEKKAEDEKAKVNRNRFLLVSVDFNEDRFPPIPDPEPKAEEAENKDAEKSKDDAEAKKDGEAEKSKDPAEAKKDGEAKEKADAEKQKQEEELKRKREEREQKIKEGKEKAKELSDRYARWYYVIPEDAFTKMRLTRKELVKEKEKSEEEKAAATTPMETETPMPAQTPDAKPGEKKSEKKAEPSKPEKKSPAEKAETPKSDAKKAEEKAKADRKKSESKPAEKPAKAEEKPAADGKKSEPTPKAEAKPEAKPAPADEKPKAEPAKSDKAPTAEPKPKAKAESAKTEPADKVEPKAEQKPAPPADAKPVEKPAEEKPAEKKE